MLLGCAAVLSVLTGLVICICTGAPWPRWLWLLPLGSLGGFLVCFLVAFLVLLVACLLVDTSKPQEEDSPFYRFLAMLYAPAACTLLGMRVHTTGLENIPKEGRFLLVCNHQYIFDPVVIMAKFPKSQLAFISKKENQTMPFIGKLMHKLLCQLINRENDREALKTILKCIHLIQEDKCSIGVFPEGHCSEDEKLQPFRAGAFKIAIRTKVPIVVCTLRGTRRVMPNLKKLRRTDVYLDLIEVIPPEDLQGQTTVDVSSHVFQSMLRHLGPAYAPDFLGPNG